MSKKSVFLSIITILVLLPLYAGEHSILIRIDTTQFRDTGRLEAMKLPVYHRNAEQLYIGTTPDRLSELAVSAYSILDSDFEPSQTYIITSETGKPVKWDSSWGRLLYEGKRELIVRSSSDIHAILKHSAYMAIPFPQTPGFYSSKRIMPPPVSSNTRTIIQDMVNQVNADSIQSYIQQLQNFGTRYYAASTCNNVRLWIMNQFTRMGYTDIWYGVFDQAGFNQYNVCATLPGSSTPDKNIVVGAHSDDNISFGNTDPMVFCPGADDNASGVAAVLEMARVFKQMNYHPDCTFRFVTFGCEEMGLFGSQHYAQSLVDSDTDVKLMINHDMIATNLNTYPDDYVVLQPYTGFESYTQFAGNMTAQYTDLLPIAGYFDSAGSDSYNFFIRGLPCVYFEEFDFSPYYHSSNDLIQYLDMDYCSRVVKSSLATGATMSSMPDMMSDFQIWDTGTGSSLQITWSDSPEPNVISYKVYVADSTDVWDQSFVVNGNQTTLTDLQNGHRYFIGLSCINAQDFESMILVKEATPAILPQTPLHIVDHPQMHAIDITWDINHELDLAGYRIFRSTVAGELGSQLNTILDTGTSYHDTAVQDGVYYFYSIKAEDTTGNLSPASDQIYSQALSFNRGVLVVDGTANGSGTSFMQPTDAQADDYYNELLANYQKSQVDLSVNAQLKLADFGPYSTIVWHCNAISGIEQAFSNREAVRQYLEMGGHLLISTYQPTLAWDMNSTYPAVFTAGYFLHDVFRVGGVNYSNAARFRYAISAYPGINSMSVDSLKSSVSLNHHLFRIEGLAAAEDGEVLFTFGSDYANDTNQGALNGTAVGIGYFGQDYQTVVLSIPLWNINFNEAKQLVDFVLQEKFNEPVGIDDPTTPNVGISKLEQNYPNPFNPETTIQYTLGKQSDVDISIYNVKGQKVSTLVHARQLNGHYSVHWNGKDMNDEPVASGVYFYRLQTTECNLTRKMLLVK